MSIEEASLETVKKPHEIKIRAHHLPIFAELCKDFHGYINRSPDPVHSAVKTRATYMVRYISWDDSGYAQDVLGMTDETKDQYSESIYNIFSDFLSSPDDTKVSIVINEKDSICEACIVGNHCNELGIDSDFIEVIFDAADGTNNYSVSLGQLKKKLLEISIDDVLLEVGDRRFNID